MCIRDSFSRFFLGNGLRLAGKAFTPKADLAETKPLASMRLRLIVPAALIAVALVMQLCGAGLRAVSYTHLDVYKRQRYPRSTCMC